MVDFFLCTQTTETNMMMDKISKGINIIEHAPKHETEKTYTLI